MGKSRVKDLLKYFYRYYFPNHFSKIGGGFTFVGLIFLISFFINIFFYRIPLLDENINYLLTFAIGLASIGIAFVSLGVSKRSSVISADSLKIAKESDKKMEAIAYATFDEAMREIEDRRLTLQARLPILQNKVSRRKIDIPGDKSELKDAIDEFSIFFQYSIWKCKTHLDRTMNFKEYFRSNPNDREQIIHQIDCLFFILAPIKKGLNLTLHDSYKDHIQNMYDTIKEFEEFNGDVKRQNRLEQNRSYLKDEGATTYQSPNW